MLKTDKRELVVEREREQERSRSRHHHHHLHARRALYNYYYNLFILFSMFFIIIFLILNQGQKRYPPDIPGLGLSYNKPQRLRIIFNFLRQ